MIIVQLLLSILLVPLFCVLVAENLAAHPLFVNQRPLLAAAKSLTVLGGGFIGLEVAATARAQGLDVQVVEAAPLPGQSGWILKMHGSVERPADIVLTRRDYMRYDEQRAALAGIVQAQLITKQMLFVGFSMADANFLRIADAVRRALRAAQPPGSPARAFGVALPLSRNALLEELWRHDLEWMPMDDGNDPAGTLSTSERARRLDIFLDYLVAKSSTATAYLLDKRYEGMLTSDELLLRDALRAFLDTIPGEAQDAPAWSQIEQLVRKLGGIAHPIIRRRPRG